jgi:hypothetical protein
MKRLILFALACAMILPTSFTYADMKEDPHKSISPLAGLLCPVVDTKLLDINNATKDQIKTLPGIDDDYCKKIIAGRPYTKMSQLVSDEIIPKAIYDKIKDHIVIIPPK